MKKPAKITPTIADLDTQIERELEAWAKADMNPQNVQINVFLLDAQVKALIKLCEFDEEELNLEYKRTVLENLKEAREQLQPIVSQARTRAMIEVPDVGKQTSFS